jgi:hypothetical protein
VAMVVGYEGDEKSKEEIDMALMVQGLRGSK